MSLAAKFAIAVAVFLAGIWAGVEIHIGLVARSNLAKATAQRADTIRQRQFNDGAGMAQALTVAKLSDQLGNAREKIALLSGRECLDPATVSMLNAIGAEPVRAAAAEPAGAAAAAAPGTGLRYSTDADTAGAIAICRARYAEVASQVNQILDVEDRRHPPGEESPR